MAEKYILHRYHVNSDKVYWQKFLEETKQYIVWLDYSQNISLTPKFEVPSAHFSGKQHTLHDALKCAPGSDKYR